MASLQVSVDKDVNDKITILQDGIALVKDRKRPTKAEIVTFAVTQLHERFMRENGEKLEQKRMENDGGEVLF